MKIPNEQFNQLKADTLELIEKYQDIQKHNRHDSRKWQEASKKLKPLFETMDNLTK